MSDIVFDLYIEDFYGNTDLYDQFSDYEEAHYTGMCVLNGYRKARKWHVTVSGQRPTVNSEPIPSSLERYHEFHKPIMCGVR